MKFFDTHGPFGLWIVSADGIANTYDLMLETFVNGEVRQRASTADTVHHIPARLRELSTAFTLQAGEVLATGTPSGAGALPDPTRYLEPGDMVRVHIEGIGYIETRVVEERACAAR
jgi:2-keto-4-pentenoate hydratase/2-oxohepta-3-ene-1,7-dioic acid hydratase in catechol pathway